jgi:hypothetical protein
VEKGCEMSILGAVPSDDRRSSFVVPRLIDDWPVKGPPDRPEDPLSGPVISQNRIPRIGVAGAIHRF